MKGTHPYVCYTIVLGRYSYVGITNNLRRRLRQHRGELVGGAKYTSSKRMLYPNLNWQLAMLVHGFPTIKDALSFEWHVKRLKRLTSFPDTRVLNNISFALRRHCASMLTQCAIHPYRLMLTWHLPYTPVPPAIQVSMSWEPLVSLSKDMTEVLASLPILSCSSTACETISEIVDE
mgnify:CR=1 FL=1